MNRNIIDINAVIDGYEEAVKLYDELDKKLENIAAQEVLDGKEVYDELMSRFKKEDEFSYNIMLGDGKALVDVIRANKYYERIIEEVQDAANDSFCTFCAYNEYEVKADLMKRAIDSLSWEDRSTMCEGLNAEDLVLDNIFWEKCNAFRYNNLFCSRDMASKLVEDTVGHMVNYGERIRDSVINCLMCVNEKLVEYYVESVECC